MKKQILLLFFIALSILSNAQGGTWTWVKGANVVNDPGNIGTLGIANAANYPEGRYQAVNWIDMDGNFWIFGGLDNNHEERNDLWKYNPSLNVWTWVNGPLTSRGAGIYGVQGVPGPSNIPGARGWGVVSWTDKQGRLWLHGGLGFDLNGNKGVLDDIWMFDIPNNEWTWMKGSNTYNNAVNYGTLQVASSTNTPGGVQECNSAWVKSDGTLWTFGGMGSTSVPNNAMWRFDISTNNWTWMGGGANVASYGTLNVSDPTNMPPARGTYTRWQDANDNFYIFGGQLSGANRSNDVWKYNASNNEWTWIAGSNLSNNLGDYTQQCISNNVVCPSARFENRTAQMLGCSNLFWVFGGGGKYLNLTKIDMLNDLWSFNAQTHQWTWVSGSNSPNAVGNYGTINLPAFSNMPHARCGVCMWVQPNGTLWIWSGGDFFHGKDKFSDMWKFEPDTTCIHSVLFLPPLSAQLSDSSICLGDSATLLIQGGHITSIMPSNSIYTNDSIHITLTPTNNTTYTVIADGSCGAKDTFYFNLNVLPPAMAGVSLGAATVVLGHTVSIQNTSTGFDSVYAIINGQIVHPIPTAYTFTQVGTNCVTIVALKNNFCLDSATQCLVVINDTCSHINSATLYPQVICSSDSSYLTIADVRNISISPVGTFTPIDSFHFWLYPKATTTYSVIATNRCDKLDTFSLVLIVSKPDTNTIYKTICAGSSFQFNGQSISIAGTYYDTLQNKYGCDSFIVLNLSMSTPPPTLISQSICSGSSIVFNSQTINQAGVYFDTISSVFNCDSIVQLILSILPPQSINVNGKVCVGDTFFYNGNVLSNSGYYNFHFRDMNNCDSVVHLNLTIVPKPIASFSITPIGDTIPFTTISATNTSQQFDTVLWLLNNQVISNPAALPIASIGNYCLRLVALSKLGCRDTSKQCFYVIENAFAIPNAFTPNGDGKNDGFYPVLLQNPAIEITAFSIYNRWGQRIYSNPALPWDGTYKGEAQPAESYIYYVELLLPDSQNLSVMKKVSRMGSFTLLR